MATPPTAAPPVETDISLPRPLPLQENPPNQESHALLPAMDSSATLSEVAKASYVPQFTTASSWILSRLKAGTQATGTIDARGANTQLAQHMAVTTLTMPTPRLQQSLPGVATRFVNSFSPSLKRKRSSDHVNADFTQNTIPFPPVPPASLHKEASETDSSQKCFKCGLVTSTPNNKLATCSNCHFSWHQQCSSILVALTSDAANESHSLCPECRAKSEKQQVPDDAEFQDRRHLVNRIRRKRLSNLPSGVVPAKPELVGFLAKQASDSDRTEYFYGKKRTDLLNILSFCDQLKPQLLVDILVSVSKKHPDLPIFDDPDWKANLSRGTSGLKRSSRVAGRSRHGHTLPNPKAPRKSKGRDKVVKQIAVTGAEGEVAEEEDEEEEENSLPPTWPKAGKGLYAKLPPEDEDRVFLEDDNDEEAFSHFMVDRFGKQMVVPACA